MMQMLMDLTAYPYPSRRTVVLGRRGAVATSQPLAALAGMEMLHKGGNAVDAALATAIALTVLQPTSNGIGSDVFAFVHDGVTLHALNASGKSPLALDRRVFGEEGVPRWGWKAVTVPGAPSAWWALWSRFGRLPFEELFAPAIRYAEEGFPVSPYTAAAWGRAGYLKLRGPAFRPFQEVFFPQGRAPRPGELWRSPLHAATLKEIARTGAESFYRGRLAQQIVRFAEATGGYLSTRDLAEHRAEWVTPLSLRYRDLEVWELPPNTQGLAALLALGILEGWDLASMPRDSVESLHLQIEAMKLAFVEVQTHVGDPRFMRVSAQELLNPDRLAKLRARIGEHALTPEAQAPLGGTVYLAAVDGELMVSLIQSNYMGFGSGVLVEGTGIALQNRGAGFCLEPGHPNDYGPGKRPFHTIIPGFLARGGVPLGPFGVMGGHMQPQGHLQVVVRMVDQGLNPQAALDAPRWQWLEGRRVALEPSFPSEVIEGLRVRGHDVEVSDEGGLFGFGMGQIILRYQGAWVAASEPRADGLALAW